MKNNYFVELVEFVKNNIVLPGDVVCSVGNNVLTFKCEGLGSLRIEYLAGIMFKLVEIEEFQFQGDDSEVYSTIVPFNKLVDILREDLEGIFEMME